MDPVDLHLHHVEMEERKKEKGVYYRIIMNIVDETDANVWFCVILVN